MAKVKVTFNGVNETGSVTIGKIVFPTGKAITVDEDGRVDIGRLRSNPEFTVQAVDAPKPKAAEQPKARPAAKRPSSRKGK